MKLTTNAVMLSVTLLLGAAYNGPDDHSAYMVPKTLNCFGVKSFPNGIRTQIPLQSTIGNLFDGLQYYHPAGMFTVIAFYFTGQGGADELDYVALKGDIYGSERTKSKGKCRVTEWHPRKSR